MSFFLYGYCEKKTAEDRVTVNEKTAARKMAEFQSINKTIFEK